MKSLLIILRAAQLFTHHAHNVCARPPFFQDHDFFGEVYSSLEGDYDSVIERILGSEGESEALELKTLMADVIALLPEKMMGIEENRELFEILLRFENQICNIVEDACKGSELSQGQKQLLGDIAQRSEIRTYKIKQRLK